MRKSKRILFKPKVFGFNPYADQVPAIKQIMEENGQQSEAPILRMLIDEALQARHRKAAGIELAQQATPVKELEKSLQTTQELLLKLIQRGEIALRIESVILELSQEALAEARAGRIQLWESLARPALMERGRSSEEIGNLFDSHTKEGQDYAYGLAEEIKEELMAEEARKSEVDQAQAPPVLLDDDLATVESGIDFH